MTRGLLLCHGRRIQFPPRPAGAAAQQAPRSATTVDATPSLLCCEGLRRVEKLVVTTLSCRHRGGSRAIRGHWSKCPNAIAFSQKVKDVSSVSSAYMPSKNEISPNSKTYAWVGVVGSSERKSFGNVPKQPTRNEGTGLERGFGGR
jgi:hypothetical protein